MMTAKPQTGRADEPSEAEIIAQARVGDAWAMAAIVDRHQNDVLYLSLGLLGNRQDAEDIMQDVFIKAFARLKGFRGESGLSTWLYRIAHNACIDHQRRKRWQTVTELFGHRKPPEQTEPPMDGPVQQPDQSLAAVEINGEIQVALDTLTAMERSVFVLRHMQELSTRQTAQVLQCSEGAVKNMLFRACKKLRTDLESRGVTV